MSLAETRKELIETCQKYNFIRSVQLIDETGLSLKFRLQIDHLTFIQIYQNISSKTTSYVLVHEFTRLFGRDCVGGRWHCHPFNNPLDHDFSKEGSKECTLCEFLDEVEKLLLKIGLI